MSEVEAREDFKPWRTDWLFGSILAGLATVFVLVATSIQMGAVPGNFLKISAAMFGVIAVFFLRRGFGRSHGASVEKKAIRDLQKKLGNGWVVTPNVEIQYGDLDALLEGPDQQRFCVEIKSQRNVRIAVGGLLSSDRLVDHKGKATAKDALAQAKSVAQQAVGTPVLWYPHAKQLSSSKGVDGVVVVCGPVKALLKALKIPRKGWF